MSNRNIETQKVESVETENKTIDSVDVSSAEKIEKLENTIAELRALLAGMQQPTRFAEPIVMKDDLITLISNTDAEVDIPFNTWRLRFSKIGQKAKITEAQFNELLNVHRFYLDSEFFLLDSAHIDLARDLRLPVMDESGKYIRPEDLDKVASMTAEQLKAYYNQLSFATQRNFVSFYLHECNTKRPGFYDYDKMTMMNTLTKGHLFDMMISIYVNENNADK